MTDDHDHLKTLLDGYRTQEQRDGELAEYEKRIRAEVESPIGQPTEAPDPWPGAVAAAAKIEDPAKARELLEAVAFPALVKASGEWRNVSQPRPVVWRDMGMDGMQFADAVVSAGEVAVLAGAGKGGKSYLTVSLAVAAHQAFRDNRPNGAACGLRIQAGSVVILSYEDSPKRIDMRAEAMGGEPGDVLLVPEPTPIYHYTRQAARWEKVQPTWDATWKAIMDAKPSLVVVDTGPKAMGGETNDPGAVIGFLQALEAEARACDCGVLVTAHDTKAARLSVAAGGNVEDPIAGSGQWHDSPRGVLHLTKIGPGDAPRLLEAVKCSYGRDGWGARLEVHYQTPSRYAGLKLETLLDAEKMAQERKELADNRKKGKALKLDLGQDNV